MRLFYLSRNAVVVLMVLSGAAASVPAQHSGAHAPAPPRKGAVRGPLKGASRTPTITFDRAGKLWAAWIEGSHVYVSSSADLGRTFGLAVKVTPQPEEIDANSESRPKIAIGPAGEVYVSWTKTGTQRFTGDIQFSRSLDAGRTFSAPKTINDDRLVTGHRFDALHVSPSGSIYLAWIDKRDMEKALAAKRPYDGAALYYTKSTDRGETFVANRKLKDQICECCRLAVDFDNDAPVLFWRDILPGSIRDHGLLRFDDPQTPGAVQRATRDGWEINACPHHGPSLSISDTGTYHMVWFTGEGPSGAGAFYARSIDKGKTLGPPMRLGSPEGGGGHAVVLSRGRTVYLAWKESLGAKGMSIQVMKSDDGGERWSAVSTPLNTQGRSDHPFLVARDTQTYLSWFTADEGLRVVPLGATPRAQSRSRT